LKLGADGLIMSPYSYFSENELLLQLINNNFPVIFVDRVVPGIKDVPFVVSDNYSGGKILGEHLRKIHGAKKILFVTHEDLSVLSVKERYEGISDGIGENPEIYRAFSLMHDFSGIHKEIIHKDIDAVFFCNDVLALRGICYLLKHGVKIPEDIIVVGFDDEPFSSILKPSLTTIKQDFEKMGQYAAFLMVKLLKKERVSIVNKIGVEMVLRESCGCL
jgi:DNA-binding LacI/PurR family transcriptional regulator